MTIKKNLIFRSVDLGGDDITLKLYLAPPPQNLFAKPPPIPWRETIMSGIAELPVEWNGQLVFSVKAQREANGPAQPCEYFGRIEPGQVTTIMEKYKDSNGLSVYSFTDPIPCEGLAGSSKAINRTGRPVTIALGFVTDIGSERQIVHPNLTWDSVGNGNGVTGTVKPTLRAFVALKYQQSEGEDWLSGGIGSSEPVWEAYH